ncbi:hypothetical protein BOW31_12755 [Solemya velum gill symbiont]|uniref:DUF2523 family protein n=1 Tax=Solemya velum gill symbiont TaxID=2340 RepID=UPI00099780B8|nr:DUF2523 family protein [Solemya velum gill symbiont]OOZ21378.1 hypothetical protein BOW31_12755 [Solemya velum gill symbiont]
MAALIYTMLGLWASGLIARMLIGAGLTLIVAGALDVSVTAMLDKASSYFTGIPQDIFDLLMLGGIHTGLSIIGGAMITKALVNTAGRIVGLRMGGTA